MARYTGPVCRLCRRASEKLFLKGERCFTPKCGVERRRKTPGSQQPRRRRVSDWGIQLREKQKARQMYGVMERQFQNYYRDARRRPGVTGAHLLQLLERRLDNVVYRLGFSTARQQARQWVLHGHFTVDGRKAAIPSFRVNPGQVVAWKPSTSQRPFQQQASRAVGQRSVPGWLELDRTNLTGKVLRNPEPQDIDAKLEVRYIVEHYSR